MNELFSHVPTSTLDAYAHKLGYASGIGRRSFFDDNATVLACAQASIASSDRILALGEGSHFVERWFHRIGSRASVTVRTSCELALEDRYDVVFAIEAVPGHLPEADFAAALRSVLVRDGRAIVALENRSSNHRRHASEWNAIFKRAGFATLAHDASERIAQGAIAYAMCSLYDGELSSNVRTSCAKQARSLLNDAVDGHFAYWIYFLRC